jgi:hypothetical protein
MGLRASRESKRVDNKLLAYDRGVCSNLKELVPKRQLLLQGVRTPTMHPPPHDPHADHMSRPRASSGTRTYVAGRWNLAEIGCYRYPTHSRPEALCSFHFWRLLTVGNFYSISELLNIHLDMDVPGISELTSNPPSKSPPTTWNFQAELFPSRLPPEYVLASALDTGRSNTR